MPIRQSDIRNSPEISTVRKSLREAKLEGRITAFLSHSHKDALLAKKLQSFLVGHGWSIYIDWEDTSMPDNPNRETADRIQKRIVAADLFLLLATANSRSSRWCPWELGYADGAKGKTPILIVPTQDDSGTAFGNEYVELYRHIDFANGGGLGHFGSDNKGNVLKGAMKP